MANQINGYSYDRNQVKAGILHFGVGNFHRAHLEYMTNKLLENETQQNWGICGAMILPGDDRLYHALKKQNGEYTLTVCGRDDSINVYKIGALVELYWGIEELEKILEKIASKDIKIITLTITEGGYNIDRQSGEFMLDNAQVAHDLKNPHLRLPLDMWQKVFAVVRQQAMALSPSSLATTSSTMATPLARLS